MIDREVLKRAGVSDGDIKGLKQAWDAFRSAATRKTTKVPRIVCTGIYNAGKSTLLNALCAEERFPTGDVPTTKKLAQSEFDGAVYIDTPGLNAEAEDDQEARSACDTADFILFVSNAQNGGIGVAEAGWLQDLRERCTSKSLKRRMVYVLTHCGQIEEEDLPGIQSQFRQDLDRACGFAPKEIFCVDSLIYREGAEKNAPELVEYSGIPRLQAHLAQRVADAEAILSKAQKEELSARRSALLEQIEKLTAALRSEQEKSSASVKKKLAEVDAVWETLEQRLKGLQGKKPDIYFDNPRVYGRSVCGEAKSKSEAKRKLREGLSPIYNSRERELRQLIQECEAALKYYCVPGMNSVYFSVCNDANHFFERCVLDLQKLKVPVSKVEEINVDPDISSGFLSEIKADLADGVVKTSGVYSLDSYVDYTDIDPFTSTERGLFGIYYDVTTYFYSDGSATREMEKDMRSAWKINCDSVNWRIAMRLDNFVGKVLYEAEKRKAVLKAQITSYCEDLKAEAASDSIQPALNHLLAVKKEAAK